MSSASRIFFNVFYIGSNLTQCSASICNSMDLKNAITGNWFRTKHCMSTIFSPDNTNPKCASLLGKIALKLQTLWLGKVQSRHSSPVSFSAHSQLHAYSFQYQSGPIDAAVFYLRAGLYDAFTALNRYFFLSV